MVSCSHIEIKTANDAPSWMTELYIDGHKVKGVRSMKYEVFAGELPTLTVDFNALDIAIDQGILLYQKGDDRQIKKIVWSDYNKICLLSELLGLSYDDAKKLLEDHGVAENDD